MPGPTYPDELRELIAAQSGVVAARQAASLGLSVNRQRNLLARGQWRRLHRGVFCTHAGPVGDDARAWAAVLAVGGDAALCDETALWHADRRGSLGPVVHVGVGLNRRVRAPAGVAVHNLADLQTTGSLPHLRVEIAVLDVTRGQAAVDDVVSTLCRVVGGRRTTPGRLLAELEQRRAHPWRRLLTDVLADVAVGAQSPLELADLRNDRAHGLPVADRQVRRRVASVGVWLDAVSRLEVVCADGGRREIVVAKELDGRLGHEATGRFRDMWRDNATTLSVAHGLRFGWADEVGQPCETAAVQTLLWRRLGAAGVGRSCHRAGCRLAERVDRLARDVPSLVSAARP